MDTAIRIIRDAFSLIYVFLLPGFFMSYIFYRGNSIAPTVRIAFSVLLSIAAVPVTVMYLSILGFPVTQVLVVSIVVAITALSVAAVGVSEYYDSRRTGK